jgi:glucose/arabinose dehydrogenase
MPRSPFVNGRVAVRAVLVTVLAAGLRLGVANPYAQQPPPDLGIAPVTLGPGPFTFDTAEQHRLRVTVVARGLAHPFSVAFLPGGDALVTERGVRVRLVRNATSTGGSAASVDAKPVSGFPSTLPFRGGGLQDIVLHPAFAANRLVYFTYNKPGEEGATPQQRLSAITLARGRFDGTTLSDVEELFTGGWNAGASGSRLAFGRDGMLYLTTGAPFNDQAQKVDSVYGKVLRLRDDGRVPADNPFVGKPGTRPEIFSLGHRDQLGLTIHAATGAVLTAEHGPNGGDEVNLILPGRNYGWPTHTFGRSYEGPRMAGLPFGPGIEAPLILWVPSIAPTGLAFYTGDRFPAWKGNLFVGSARRGEIPRTGGLERVVLTDKLDEVRRETLLTDLHQRIRDVRQGPDGLLYVLTDEDDGALLRLEPVAP